MKQFARGFIIGVSSTIPGVCSALVAMFLNSYNTMLDVIEKFYKPQVLIKNIGFILGVFVGIISCIIGMSLIFKDYEFILKILFLGLTIGGFINISKRCLNFSIVDICVILLGIMFSLIPELLIHNSTTNSNLILIIIGGFLSSLAFIMPGISGSLLLLTLGIYQILITSFSDLFQILIRMPQISSIYNCAFFLVSFVVGAVIFSKLIKKFFIKYEKTFLKFCLGLLIGTMVILFLEVFRLDFNWLLKIVICLGGILLMKFFHE